MASRLELDFWRGRRVLLTGHTGFKGAWLALWLEQLGAELVGFSLPEAVSEPSLFELAHVQDGMGELRGDVRDPEALQQAFALAQPEVVIHMAAQSLVRPSFISPRETYETNVMGTVNLLEAVRGCRETVATVVVTSDKCYENREWEWGYREDEPMGGHDPYSSSKGAAELACASWRNSFGMPLASARAGNVIGGGDFAAERLVPDLMRAALAGETLRVRNPGAVRPWQHVLGPLSGYLLLAERLAGGDLAAAGAWNFGPAEEDAQSVQWIVERLGARWEGLRWEPDPGPHPHEANFLKLDCARARARLGWRPAWDLERGLDATADWYRALAAGEDVRALARAQVAAYASAACG